MAEWLHLFPSRTEQLSTHTPKIVFAKIGRCLIFFLLFFFSRGGGDAGNRKRQEKNEHCVHFVMLIPYSIYPCYYYYFFTLYLRTNLMIY